MRAASRVVGIVLAFAGLIFVSLGTLLLFRFHPQSVLAGSAFGRPVWTGTALVGLGIGLLFLGWYYFRLDVDAPEPSTSRFGAYFLAHRRELKLLTHVGLAISLIRFGALCFGINWPGRWATLVLLIVGVATSAAEGSNARHGKQGRPLVKLIRNAVGAAMYILLLFLAWSQYSHQQAGSGVSLAAIIVLLFASESMETWSITASSR